LKISAQKQPTPKQETHIEPRNKGHNERPDERRRRSKSRESSSSRGSSARPGTYLEYRNSKQFSTEAPRGKDIFGQKTAGACYSSFILISGVNIMLNLTNGTESTY
jgi:hypothetical protein